MAATDTDGKDVGQGLLKKEERDTVCVNGVGENEERMRKTKGSCSKLSLDRKWLVLLMCSLCHFLVYGCIPSFGVFLPEILNLHGGKKSVAVWIGSLEVGMLFLIGPLATYLIHLLGYRLVVIGGSILASLGFISTIFTVNIYSMYITFGIMIGSGGGLISAASVVALHDYFKNNFATASGVVFAGGAIGLTLYPIFVDKLQTFYGFKMSLLIHASLFLNCVVCGAVMKPRYPEKSRKDNSKFDLTILRSKLFFLNLLGAIFNTVGYYIPIFFLTEFAISRNYTKTEGAFLVTLHGLSAIVARPLCGWLTDRQCVNKLTFYAMLPLLEAVVIACFPSSGLHYWILIVLSILNGILGMPFTSMIAAILSDLFGPKSLPTAYGLWLLANGVGILIGPPIAGWIYDVTQSYSGAFYFSAGMLSMSGLSLLLVSILKHFQKTQLYAEPGTDRETVVTDQ